MSLLTTAASLVTAEVRMAFRSNIQRCVVYGLAGLSTLGAVIYGLSALHRCIAWREGPLAADLWMAGGLLVLALLCVAAARYSAYRQRRRVTLVKAATAAPLALGLLLRQPKLGVAAVVAALVVGNLLGRLIDSKR
jgi:uncharacterized membrane protein